MNTNLSQLLSIILVAIKQEREGERVQKSIAERVRRKQKRLAAGITESRVHKPDHGAEYIPTPEEIEAACKEIRAKSEPVHYAKLASPYTMPLLSDDLYNYADSISPDWTPFYDELADRELGRNQSENY